MILDQMKKVDYDKYHKPYPDTNLDLSINIFIDNIQGIISEYLEIDTKTQLITMVCVG